MAPFVNVIPRRASLPLEAQGQWVSFGCRTLLRT
jgi:hypothetical protein